MLPSSVYTLFNLQVSSIPSLLLHAHTPHWSHASASFFAPCALSKTGKVTALHTCLSDHRATHTYSESHKQVKHTANTHVVRWQRQHASHPLSSLPTPAIQWQRLHHLICGCKSVLRCVTMTTNRHAVGYSARDTTEWWYRVVFSTWSLLLFPTSPQVIYPFQAERAAIIKCRI